jgi:DNA-binding response OmpR family regulator
MSLFDYGLPSGAAAAEEPVILPAQYVQWNAMAGHPDTGTQVFHRRHARQGLRVVVADDDRDMVATLTVILETAGHNVHPVYDGRDVLPTARLVRPDAIILDISVPGMSGYAVAQAIRHSFTEARRPLLIGITGMWKEAPDRLVAQQVGFDHHFTKPCEPREVLAVLDSLQQPDRP